MEQENTHPQQIYGSHGLASRPGLPRFNQSTANCIFARGVYFPVPQFNHPWAIVRVLCQIGNGLFQLPIIRYFLADLSGIEDRLLSNLVYSSGLSRINARSVNNRSKSRTGVTGEKNTMPVSNSHL